jgi:hypothetical protein
LDPPFYLAALGIFTASLWERAAGWACARWKEAVMDLWFIGLIVVLAGLTWGGIVLCERLLVRP